MDANWLLFGRHRNTKRSRVAFEAEPKLRGYLQDLVDLQEGYGNTLGSVAHRLVWQRTGRLQSKGYGKLSGHDVEIIECPDCLTTFTREPGRALTINRHTNDGLCPWCRPDSKPWTRGRGK